MEWIFIVGGIVFLIFILGAVTSGNEDMKKYAEKEKIRQHKETQQRIADKELYEATKNDLVAKYGECTKEIGFGGWNVFKLPLFVFVYEQPEIIFLNGREYKFADILGYSLVDDATNETITTSEGVAKTSTGSMLGRAVVGGVLTGGLGAVAGAATAASAISAIEYLASGEHREWVCVSAV